MKTVAEFTTEMRGICNDKVYREYHGCRSDNFLFL